MALVQPANDSDLPDILAIHNHEIAHSISVYRTDPLTMDDRRVWFAEHQAQNLPILVVRGDQGQVIGWGSLSQYRPGRGYFLTVENTIFVHPDHRGKGIGKAILSQLVKEAGQRGKHAIVASVDTRNVASMALHAACGYQQVALFKEIGYKFGEWLDVAFMEYLFPRP
ncbi:MAG: N-acetyltransferase family protein [Anaerolineae bacterium]